MLPAQYPPPFLKPVDAHAAEGSERPATHSLVSLPHPISSTSQFSLMPPKGILQPTHFLPPLCYSRPGLQLSLVPLTSLWGPLLPTAFLPPQWPVTTLTNSIPTSRSSWSSQMPPFSSPFAEASLCPLPLLGLQDSAQEFLPQESLTCALTNKDAHTWLHLEAGTQVTLSHAGL